MSASQNIAPPYVEVSRRTVLILSSILCLFHLVIAVTFAVLATSEIKKDVKHTALHGVGYADVVMEFLAALLALPMLSFSYMRNAFMFLISTISALGLQALLILNHGLLIGAEVHSGLRSVRSRFDRPWMPWVIMVVVISKTLVYGVLYGFLGYAAFVYWNWLDRQEKQQAGADPMMTILREHGPGSAYSRNIMQSNVRHHHHRHRYHY